MPSAEVGDRPIALEAIRAARERIRGHALRTPLLRFPMEDAPAEIWLKVESLQPTGAFKIRGAANVMLQADPATLAGGVYTASAGNMAQGVAHMARVLGIPCAVIVPDTAPESKLAAIERLGGEIVKVPFDEWWAVFETRRHDRFPDRVFVHAFADREVMAGNGTIGLEILEDLPDVDAVIVPYGGGGLSCGISSAVRALKPEVTVLASEAEPTAPLLASLEAGRPMEVEFTPHFVDGIGGKGVFAEMWPLTERLLDGSIAVSLAETATAVRLMVERNRVVAEGAGGTSLAAALTGAAGSGKVVCVISGGNIDAAKLATILSGGVP